MRQLFLSHSTEDASVSKRLREQLLAERPADKVHLSSEADAGPIGGTRWESWIRNVVTNCDVVVFIASQASFSAWCSAELGMARLLDKPIIPLYVGSNPEVNPLIGEIQAAPLDQPIQDILALIDHRLGTPDGVAPIPDGFVPYPGLTPLVEGQSAMLFGRDAARKRINAEFSPAMDPRLVIVSGPSGSGKSSLVRAGVMADLAVRGWQVVGPLRPLQVADGALSQLLSDRPQVVVVDQAEETALLEDRERKQTTAALREALTAGVWVMVVVRSEFRTEIGRDLPPAADHYLPFLAREDLYDVIRGPARLKNLGIKESLVDRLVGEAGSGEALPLLALTLHELWKRRDTLNNQLTETALTDIGGVGGVLENMAADALLQALNHPEHEEPVKTDDVLRTLTRLASPDRLPPTRSAVRADRLTLRERDWIDEFAKVGLVTYRTRYSFDDRLDAGRRPTGDDLVDISHEAMLSWSPLAGAIERERARNLERQSIERSAEEWHAGGRSDSTLLLAGDRLEFARSEDLQRSGELLKAFVDESTRNDRDRKIKRLLTIGLGVATVLAIAAAGAALYLGNVAAQERDSAQAAEVISQSLRMAARSAASVTDQRDFALLAAVAAQEISPNVDTEAAVVAALIAPEGPLKYFEGTADGVRWDTMSVLDEDRGLIAGPARRATEINFTTGSLRPIGQGTDLDAVAIDSIERAPNSVSLVYRGQHIEGGWAAGVFDFENTRTVIHDVGVRSVAANGEWLVFGDFDGGVYAAALTDDGVGSPQLIDQHDGEIIDLDLSRDGRHLAVASVAGVRLLTTRGTDWTDQVDLHQVGAGAATVEHVAFRRDLPPEQDPELYGTGSDPDLRRWRIGPGGVTQDTVGRHSADVYAVAMSSDSALFVVAGRDGSIRRWDLDASAEIGPPLLAHRSEVIGLSLQDGQSDRMVSTDSDRAIVWDLQSTRTVERQDYVPAAWSGQSISALVLGDGPLAAVTIDGRVLTGTETLAAPGGVTRAWWAADNLVFERRNEFRPSDGVTAWLSDGDQPVVIADDASAIDVGECLAAVAKGPRIDFIDVGVCGTLPAPILLDQSDSVVQLAFSADGQALLVALRNVEVIEFAVDSGTVLSSLEPAAGTVVTSVGWVDEDTVVLGHDRGGPAEIIDLGAGQITGSLDVHDDAVRAIDTSSSGRLFMGSEDGRISQFSLTDNLRLVSLFSARARTIENDPAAVIGGLRYVEEDGVLLSLQDARVVAWELRPDRLVSLACERAGRRLTDLERQTLDLDPTIGVC